MKTHSQITLDWIFGRGGRLPVAALVDAGDGSGEGRSVGDMVKAKGRWVGGKNTGREMG